MSIHIAIVEDEKAVRNGLKLLIDGTQGYKCVALYPSAEEALRRIFDADPDVVLMDIHLPGMSGIECVRRLKKQNPKFQIVMLTIYEDDEEIFKSLAAGAHGYILKKTPPVKLLEAITEVYNGGSPMSTQIARRVVDFFQMKEGATKQTEKLSGREQEILSFLSKGYRYKEIADVLCISIETVRTHIRNIYEKLQVHSRTEALLKFLGK
ncbi:MAG: response regulator transcription factor [Calditrichia bacterium]